MTVRANQYACWEKHSCDTITMLCFIYAEFPELMTKHVLYASHLEEKQS